MGQRSEEKRAKVGVRPAAGTVEPPELEQAQEPPPPRPAARWLREHGAVPGICLFLVLATLAAFGRTIGHEFVSFDDNDYVYENRHVRDGLTWEAVTWAFTHVHSANWHPLTTLSHELDCSLYGLWAPGHHLTNLFLHAAASVVLFLALRRLTGAVWRSGLVAAFFCLHPLHVESVAWVSERKDVLSGLFFGSHAVGLRGIRTEQTALTPGPSPGGRGEETTLTPCPSPGYGRGETCVFLGQIPGRGGVFRPGPVVQADAGDAAVSASPAGLLATGEVGKSERDFAREVAAAGPLGRVVRGDVSRAGLGRRGCRRRRADDPPADRAIWPTPATLA